MINPTPAAPPPSKNPPGSSGKQAAKPKSYGAATLKVALTAASVAATLGGWGLISATAPEMKAEFGNSAVAQVQSAPAAANTTAPATQNKAQNQAQTPIGPVAPKATAVPTVRPQATAVPQARAPQPAPRARTRSSR